ncbi:hypothetical protein [Photobacterium sp. Hal280]|uniref:hypothetical protein n=1 Tax=Photobacterium sp. Hal280 TaxID=3035163 RepID=UPI00301CAE1D
MFIATEHKITDLDTFSQKAGPALGHPLRACVYKRRYWIKTIIAAAVSGRRIR